MRIYHSHKSLLQTQGIHTFEFGYIRNIILKSRTVHFPIHINTSLVFRDWVEFTLFVYDSFFCFYSTFTTSDFHQLADSRRFHDILRRNEHFCFLHNCCTKTHSNQRSQANRNQIGSNTKLIMLKLFCSNFKESLFQFRFRCH